MPITSTDAEAVGSAKQVHFAPKVVTIVHEAPVYDRTACDNDIFSCDVCAIQIPAGIKGFEPYATCTVCEDGFDACGACCGTEAVMRICHLTLFSPSKRPTIKSKCHQHILEVMDRRAEILWANNLVDENRADKVKPGTKRPASMSPQRKKPKLGEGKKKNRDEGRLSL